MYYRKVADLTREHIRSHLPAYLTAASAQLDKSIALPQLSQFTLGSYVGGVAGIDGKGDMPSMAIDAMVRTPANDAEDLFLYRYDGSLTAMFSARDGETVELIAKGYQIALDLFAMNHQYRPTLGTEEESFTITGFWLLRSSTFGAAKVKVEDRGTTSDLWVDGLRADLAWTVSEVGRLQHD